MNSKWVSSIEFLIEDEASFWEKEGIQWELTRGKKNPSNKPEGYVDPKWKKEENNKD